MSQRWYSRIWRRSSADPAGEVVERTGDATEQAADAGIRAADGARRAAASRIPTPLREEVTRFGGLFTARRPPAEVSNALPSWRNTATTALTFFVYVYVLAVEIWIIVQTANAPRSTDNSVDGSGVYTSSYPVVSTTAGRTFTTHITGIYEEYSTITTSEGGRTFIVTERPKTARTTAHTTSTPSAASNKKVQKNPIPTSKGNSGDMVSWGRMKRDGSNQNFDIVSLPSLHIARQLTPTGKATNVSADCLYYNGSELPKHGGLSLALTLLYNIWIVLFIMALLYYERRRLRFKRQAHSAAVLGGLEFWLATDYLSRSVEIQVQIAAAAIYIVSALNLLYGLPHTHRRGESLFPYLLRRDDDITRTTARSAVPRRPGAPRVGADNLFASAADAAAEAKLDGVLDARDLAITDAEQEAGELTDLFNTTGKTRLDGTVEGGTGPSAEARKYVLGGVGQPGRRWYQRDPQEMLYGILQPGAYGTGGTGGGTGAAGGGEGGTGGGGGGAAPSAMERTMTALLAMQLLNGTSGAGGMGGMGGLGGMRNGMGYPGALMGGMAGMPGMGANPMMPGAMPNAYNPIAQRFPGMAPGLGGVGGMAGMSGMQAFRVSSYVNKN
ncbi:MAG: hypothetical protein CYPHOPRED_002060 [Cyphobasidiales sp. Tagirdzhanova-0007]|nr:MAG: hypothetical protein CYPHOPRED_002060 [Cyphobasidiales sp. Tagirdzhanova-0007]